MAKTKEELAKELASQTKPIVTSPVATPVRTSEIIMAELEKALKAKDYKTVSKLSAEIAKADAEKEKAEREKALAGLATITTKVTAAIQKAIDGFKAEFEKTDVIQGVWFSLDFAEKPEVGINPKCRLVKVEKGSKGGAVTKSGSGSYISRPEKTADLLAQVGEKVMFKEATEVTIDKASKTMSAGTTYKEAHEASDNGGWRNRVRMALLKEAGLV